MDEAQQIVFTENSLPNLENYRILVSSFYQ